ncbi:pilus assembly protein TadD, partial [bacterium]|nr:pilus assembly protein TadD [bacterium]
MYDTALDYYYKPYWDKDSLYVLEFRKEGKDTVHKRLQKIDYVVGSGQHTNSHIFSVNGYLYQAPITFYTQKHRWDLAPGFEKGANSRFGRLIQLECMSCHNGYPDFVKGSENKFNNVPKGIDCERCHGPGSLHVFDRQNNKPFDTSKGPDYTIVNPRRLPTELQNNVCQRC